MGYFYESGEREASFDTIIMATDASPDEADYIENTKAPYIAEMIDDLIEFASCEVANEEPTKTNLNVAIKLAEETMKFFNITNEDNVQDLYLFTIENKDDPYLVIKTALFIVRKELDVAPIQIPKTQICVPCGVMLHHFDNRQRICDILNVTYGKNRVLSKI